MRQPLKIRSLLIQSLMILLIVWLTGCLNINRPKQIVETILIPTGQPVQLTESIEAKVFVYIDGEKVKSNDKVLIPAGWWCLPDPGE